MGVPIDGGDLEGGDDGGVGVDVLGLEGQVSLGELILSEVGELVLGEGEGVGFGVGGVDVSLVVEVNVHSVFFTFGDRKSVV